VFGIIAAGSLVVTAAYCALGIPLALFGARARAGVSRA
jgi:hypothetical protein